MDGQNSIHSLHHHWARLSETETDDPDTERSLAYFFAETGCDPETAPTSRRVSNWIDQLRELERYVERTGKSPRRNSRRRRHAGDPLEEKLANWVRHQRRSETSLCTYQRERLECLGEFSWAPNDDAWDDQLERLKAHIAARGVRPVLRAEAREERRLARWLRGQIVRERRKTLEKHRADEFSAVYRWRR